MARLKCNDAPHKPLIGCQLAQAGSRSPSRDEKVADLWKTLGKQPDKLHEVKNDRKVLVLYKVNEVRYPVPMRSQSSELPPRKLV